MKKFIAFCFILSALVQSCICAYGSQTSAKIYKTVPLIDAKTDAEMARTLVPEKYDVNYDIIWTKDFEQPVSYTVTAKPNDEDTFFFYSSPKTYVQDISDSVEIKKSKIDSLVKITKKKYSSPEDFILELIHTTNPDIEDVKLVLNKDFPTDLTDYLNGEMLKKAEAIQSEIKADLKSTKAIVSSSSAKPYIAVYSFKSNGKMYKQMFLTMFVSLNIEFTKEKGYDEYQTVTKKLWTNTGFYSYRTLDNNFDKNYDDFIVFAANTIPNQKAVSAVNLVKKQMIIELNPSFSDFHTKSRLKHMPSELFRRYYAEGFADYSEDISLKMPTVNNSCWLINFLSPQNCFWYMNFSSVYKQVFYLPEKYEYVCYNPVEKFLSVNTKSNKPNLKYIRLKMQK